MNKTNKLGINFNLKFQDIQAKNPSFDSAKIAIAYAGRNRNKSSISKEAFELALPTIKNVPLVGRYIEDEDDFGSHDVRVVVKDDSYDVQNATVPFGLIPESASQWWETVTEEDGTVRDYLYTDCLLWKRQAGYECLAKQGEWHQSMEIDLNKYVIDNDGYCVIEDFVFTAFCILGNNVEPCFESASVQLTSDAALSTYKHQFSLMLEDLKKESTTEEKEGKTKEEKFMLITDEIRDKILTEFNVKLEDLTFEITNEMTEEQFRDSVEKMSKVSEPNKGVVEGEQEKEVFENPTKMVEFASTYEQKRQAISSVLPRNDEEACYLMDFDNSYVYVERWSFEDDSCKQEFFRTSYKYDEASMSASIGEDRVPVVSTWVTMAEQKKINEDRDLLEELKSFKAKKVKEEHDSKIDEVVAEFNDLEGFEEFNKLKETMYDFDDVENLREKCYAIKGKHEYSKPVHQTKASVKVAIPDGSSNKTKDPVGTLFEKFSKK